MIKQSNEEGKRIEFVEIASTYNQGDIAVIRSILEGSGIKYFLQDEFFNIARPFLEPVKVMVEKSCAEDAKELLKDIDLTFFIGRAN